MKKSLLNIAATMALSSAVFSGSVLSTQAYADEPVTDNIGISDNNTNNSNTSETYIYPGMGIGAATGTLFAGPVGLVVGGLIGAFVGSSQEVSSTADLTLNENTSLAGNNTAEDTSISENDAEIIDDASLTAGTSELASLQVAQSGPVNTVVDDTINSQQDKLLDILTDDLSLDIYFRSGSTNIESFYPARLVAIANLLETMDQLELHLDGYTDRRGNKSQNIELARQRIENVRQQLINSGVDENRIISKAFGEIKMVSTAGDLEAYTFDRKVVIRFVKTTADSIRTMNTALSSFETDKTTGMANIDKSNNGSRDNENADPVVADATTRF